MPQYIHAFVLASDITFHFPNLGSWDFSNEGNSHFVINTLMEYAFAEQMRGNVGPFSFRLPKNSKLDHNYQIKRSGGLMIVLPGAQVVGYVMNTIPKFPRVQEEISLKRTECECKEVFKLSAYEFHCKGKLNGCTVCCKTQAYL